MRRTALLSAFYVIGFFLSLAGNESMMLSTEDTDCYFRFARSLRQLDFGDQRWSSDLCLATRTPGFPAAIAVGEFLAGEAASGLLLVHLLAGLGAVILLAAAVPDFLGAFAATAVLLLCEAGRLPFFVSQAHHNVAMTEWLAMQGVLGWYFLAALVLERPSPLRCFFMSLLYSCTVLVRPNVFVPLGAGVALLLFLSRRAAGSKQALALLAGFLPLLVWCGWNAGRFGRLTVTPYTGLNALGVAGMLGAADVYPNDDAMLAAYLSAVNARREAGEALLNPFAGDVFTVNRGYNYMMWDGGASVGGSQGLTPVQMDEFSFEYFRRVISASPTTYLSYIFNQLRLAAVSFAVLAFATFASIALLRNGRYRTLALAGLIVCTVHLLCLLSYAMIAVELPRYLDMTGAAVAACGVLCAFLLIPRRSF